MTRQDALAILNEFVIDVEKATSVAKKLEGSRRKGNDVTSMPYSRPSSNCFDLVEQKKALEQNTGENTDKC